MMSVVPADLFTGAADIPEPGADTDDTIETSDPISDPEPAIADTPAIEEPEIEDEPAETEEPVAAEPADKTPAATTEDELPEGVRKGKDRKGKDGYFLEENRYQTFHTNHKLVQEGTQLLGEPLTADSIKLRNDAYLGQERLFTNLNSGDPVAQADVVGYILKEMTGARDNGEVGIDPTVPFAQAVYNTIRDNAPDAYATLRLQAGRDLVGEMFDAAAKAGDQHLFSSAQRFAAAIANVGPKPADMTDGQYAEHVREVTGRMEVPFYTLAEMQGLVRAEDPMVAARKRIAELESKVNGRSQAGTAEQYDTWSKNNIKAVNTAVLDDAVKPSLASVEAGWKNFPDDYKRLVIDPLHREVVSAIKADPILDQQVKDLQVRARRATSEQVRQQLGTQIQQLFVNRAKLAVEQKAKPIVKFAADWLKGRSDQTHERRNSAQTRTTPKGPSAPVRTSLTPPDLGFKDGVFDSKVAMKQAMALMR